MNVVMKSKDGMDRTSLDVARKVWQKRLGHLNDKVVQRMLGELACEVEGKVERDRQSCSECAHAKHKTPPANGELIERGNNVTIHPDICGPMVVRST